MLPHLSLYTSWRPRTHAIHRIFLRSSASASDQSSHSRRSISRFSVKIARFLYLERRIHQTEPKTFVPLSTYAHYSKYQSSGDIHELSRNFVLSLEPEHRRILQEELNGVENPKAPTTTRTDTLAVLPSQLVVVFLETGLPYVGFGFVDNFVMLAAGETIETFFGAALCLSTMAAAGLGNSVSDVMGIGLADRIERICGRFLAVFGITAPKLTDAQWRTRTVHTTQLMSKVICIFLGCVLGMCPLLFRDTSSNKHKSTKQKED